VFTSTCHWSHPETDESSPHLPTLFFKIHSNTTFPYTPRSSEWSLQVFQPNFSMHSHISNACYISHPSHLPWFDQSNNIWWSIQLILLLIMQSSSASCHFFRRCSHFFSFQLQTYLLIRSTSQPRGVRVSGGNRAYKSSSGIFDPGETVSDGREPLNVWNLQMKNMYIKITF